MDNQVCINCEQKCENFVQNADLPVCRECLTRQAESLKEYHVKIQEIIKKFIPLTQQYQQIHYPYYFFPINILYYQNPSKKIYQPEVDEIIPNKLYLGNFEGALDLELLKSKGITHILVAGEFLDISKNYPNDFIYLQIPIQDSLNQSILEFLDQTYEFIETADKVFVHCAAGINRSPAIVCAYLMKKNNWPYDQAFDFVKERRKKANKQTNFAQQLYQYEKQFMK